MVYTEYFARGTQPTEYCDVHTSAGIPIRIASGVGVVDTPAVRIDSIGVPAVPPPPPSADAQPATASPDTTAPTTTAKRRGFWGRVFGLGRGGQSRQPESPPPAKKPGG